MKIIVFGKDGQLGKAFRDLFDSILSVSSCDDLTVTYSGRAECDLSDINAITHILESFQPDLIINASAYTAVDKAETEVDLAYTVNARAPEVMAQFAAKHGATFLHYSTDYVFDGSKSGSYVEDDQRKPLGIYGKSKAAGEEAIAKVFEKSTSGQYAIFRTSWVYGDGGNFIRTILRLAKDREELKIIHDQHGVPTSADWLARVSLSLALSNKCELNKFPSGIYHAVPNGETTWHGLACLAVQSALDAGVTLKASPSAIKPILAVEYPLPAPRPMNSCMQTSKLKNALAKQLADGCSSYNDAKDTSVFPAWDVIVQEYVAKLAAEGLI